jgi:hypothetical protein
MIKKVKAVVEYEIHGEGGVSVHTMTVSAVRDMELSDLAMKIAELVDARVKLLGDEFTRKADALILAANAETKRCDAMIAEMKGKLVVSEPDSKPVQEHVAEAHDKRSMKRHLR